MKKLIFVMSVFTMMLVSCTQPVQEGILEETTVVVESTEDEPVQQPEDEETVDEEPTVEEETPEPDVWLEVSFDETSDYSSEYVYLPVDFDPYEYVFKDSTNPNAEYQLFKFDYVKTVCVNATWKDDDYSKLRNKKDSTEIYDVVKLYKLYVNGKFTNDNVNFFYKDVSTDTNSVTTHGYGLEKTDDGYNLMCKKFWGKVWNNYHIITIMYTDEVTEE